MYLPLLHELLPNKDAAWLISKNVFLPIPPDEVFPPINPIWVSVR
jgi:hypothetical protein